MNKEFLQKINKIDNKEILYHKKAQSYLLKYVRELQLHFDLSDKNLKKIINDTNACIKSPSPIQKFFNMLKSN